MLERVARLTSGHQSSCLRSLPPQTFLAFPRLALIGSDTDDEQVIGL
jgi:hypothetical protein